MKKRKKQSRLWIRLFLLACGGLIVVTLGWLLQLDLARARKMNERGPELPTIQIYLNDVTLDEIKSGDKSTKYEDNVLELVTREGVSVFDDVEIKGRGNSTWGLPKAPYQIKFEQKTDLLGLGAAKKWVLLANYLDGSNLRNDVALKFAGMIGEKYVTRGEFVRVMIDDSYEGLYYLTHKIEIDKKSVDLRDRYGVLMEVDNLHREYEDCIETDAGVCLVLKDLVEDDDEVEKEAISQFLAVYNAFEKATRRKDYEAIVELVDVRSFAEYYLVSEFSANPDAYCSSFFLYKNGENDKIHAGPVWDFDYAFGNYKWNWSDDDKIYSPYETMALRDESAIRQGEKEKNGLMSEIYYLMEMPEFRDEVRKVFREKLSGRSGELLDWMRMRRDLIRDEAVVNAWRWGLEDFDEAVEYLLDWAEERFDYFEQEYGKGEFETKNEPLGVTV